jgi:hypothetical protein
VRAGQWYYTTGQATLGHLSEFQAIEPPHAPCTRRQRKPWRRWSGKGRAEQLLEEMRAISREIVSHLDALYQAASHESVTLAMPKAA